MALSAAAPSPPGLRERVLFAGNAILGSYAQILFGRSRLVGFLLLLATAVDLRMLFAGFAAVLLALGTARVLDLSSELIASGLYGYNALLIGLGGAAFVESTPLAIGLFTVAVMASVLITATLHSALGAQFNLPTLTLPFLAVFHVVTGTIPLADLPMRTFDADAVATLEGLSDAGKLYLQSLGAIFFLPRIDAGAVVLAALLTYSRIATLLSAVAFGLVAFFGAELFVLGDPMLRIVLGYNCILIAVALGGVWFVPSPSSFVLAVAGALAGGIFTLGTVGRLAYVGVPLLILPFNLTVLLVLYAMRQRMSDGRPKAVDFLPGSPEQNLNYFRTRLARFGSRYFVRISAPFLGRWVCTQSVEGTITHRDAWRHALDFQVADDDGELFTGDGSRLEDYRCYRLPVIAPAKGIVALVVDEIPDNPVGEINVEDNWGNLVIVYHAPGLYSLVCHLSPGTITVKEGQHVRLGQTLGHCGNSGRSPTPHLHFQLQATARVGAPTLALELQDLIVEDETGETMVSVMVPSEGTIVRNVQPEPTLAGRLRFEYGETLLLETDGRIEELVADIDLNGTFQLTSRDLRATIYYDHTPSGFIVWDAIGDPRSSLRLMRTALSRVPFDQSRSLSWSDHLPTRGFLPWFVRPFADFIAPFQASTGVEMRYRVVHADGEAFVRGESPNYRHDGAPAIRSEARISARGLEEVLVEVRGRSRRAVRVWETSDEAEESGPLTAGGDSR